MADDGRRRKRASRGKLRRYTNVESVMVEETFALSDHSQQVGNGCYVSATAHNNRYYGVLIEQAALKAASLLHFQDEAESLELNKRMKIIKDQNAACAEENTQKAEDDASAGGKLQDRKRPASDSCADEQSTVKRTKVDDSFLFAPATTAQTIDSSPTAAKPQSIQKFRYVEQNAADTGYRELLATYASVGAASEDDAEKAKRIEQVCNSGGGFVGNYYYQYEILGNVLKTSKIYKPTDIGLRTSLGLDSFLRNTTLPPWYPLCNLEAGQKKVLSMLQLKRNNNGDVIWDCSAVKGGEGTLIPMEPRERYRVGVIGAGIAGLSCARELLLQAEQEHVDLEVVLLEGRSRVGGRLLTDDTTFKSDDRPFPVDLGASWIHGIDHNPLAALAKQAGITFVTSSEEVKMLTENMGEVDPNTDERIGDLFDELLDRAADDCWEREDFDPTLKRSQDAVRWYASFLEPGSQSRKASPPTSDAPPHRHSTDISIDHAIGNAIAKDKQREFVKLSKVEQSLLLWNTKNIEYALGANISDLSMKFWDSDDRHAFEGDHVLLKEGFSHIVQHMLDELITKGDRFRLVKNVPVSKVEYARRSTALPYPDRNGRNRKMVDLSDTCCVTSRGGDQTFAFDFVVSSLPLGVLKDSIESGAPDESGVSFQPPLPFTKCDSIRNVGFGLLNKIYLQFPVAFWRMESVLPDGQVLFGNASGVNPHHYMFFDVGKLLKTENDSPAVLMTLISGREAVDSEQLSDDALVNEVLRTLRTLFSDKAVPEPLASKATRWGADEFSRGCYTFLPPGTSDQDFQILQTPINGNGDSLVLEGSETMRLFWAGEHTTSLHPSMAHGAMLSGIRAAKEVVAAIQFRNLHGQASVDKLVPLAIFRTKHPDSKLQCNLCHLEGSRAREGSLLAFQKGSRQVLAHNNCAENSPEVEVFDGRWKNVIKAINRGKQITCALCGQDGATIGCTHVNCFRSYHFSCGEDTGWRFERDGKVFYCDLHRRKRTGEDALECDSLSVFFYQSRHKHAPLKCALCCVIGDDDEAGNLMAFQQRDRQILVHRKCLEFTTTIETVAENDNGEKRYRNILEAISLSRPCSKCGLNGASIVCSKVGCGLYIHFGCAQRTGWDFGRKGKHFQCALHRDVPKPKPVLNETKIPNSGIFQHDLFRRGAETMVNGSGNAPNNANLPSNAPNGGLTGNDNVEIVTSGFPEHRVEGSSDGFSSSDDESEGDVMTQPLVKDASHAANESEVNVTLERSSLEDPWKISFGILDGPSPRTHILSIETGDDHDIRDGLESGDIVVSINGSGLGSSGRANLKEVMSLCRDSLSLELGVIRSRN